MNKVGIYFLGVGTTLVPAAGLFVIGAMRPMMGASVNALANSPSYESTKSMGAMGHRNIVDFASQSAADDDNYRSAAPAAALAAPRGGYGGGPGAAPPAPPLAPSRMSYSKSGLKGAAKDAQPTDSSDGEVAGAKAAPTRSWFPESFLFQPLVVTDAAGRAALNVPVPDRLTTWRVLGLAHSNEGGQAGAITEFLGTLPAYVDPVVPGFLLVGDEVRLPVQVVNTTDQAISMPLSLEASNGTLDHAGGPMKVGAFDTQVAFTTLKTSRAGEATLKATFGTTDAVVRSIPVKPSGKPYSELRGGTLAAPRTLDLTGPADLDPETSRVRLLVYPGALALLRSELSAASSRSGAAEDAYALLLAGRAPQLLSALGDKPNSEALRGLALVAGQRVIRGARSPDVALASIYAEASAAHPENPILERLGLRLADEVARGQRPDGTFEGGAGWTLQRLLVVTADCTYAVTTDKHNEVAKQRAAAVSLKASGAFERNLERIQDGYTAAVVLGSGAVSGTAADKLRAKVREAVVQNADGSRSLPVPKGVVRPDGQVPSQLEATARAALALEGDEQAPWRADLGASLLGGYSSEVGWGDGATNLVALRAVTQLFREPLPASIKITLEVDGKPAASGELSGDRLHDVLPLEAAVANAAGTHHFVVTADPPVPGLGFALTLQGYTPWKAEAGTGLELAITTPADLKVGESAQIDLEAGAPAGVALKLREALPAGTQPDTASLDALVAAGTIKSYHVESGAVEMSVPALPSGHTFAASYRVVPTLAGRLHAPASTLSVERRPNEVYHLPPSAWTIKS